MALDFEWDERKAEANVRKHDVDFEDASTVFRDRGSITINDPEHSWGEARYLILGMSARGRLLVVAHTERGERIRIISARPATRPERRKYEEENR